MSASNNSYIVSAGYDLTIHVTPIDQSTPIQTYTITNSQINRIIPTKEGKFFIASNPYIQLYELSPKSKTTQFTGHQTNVTDIAVDYNKFLFYIN